MSEVIIPKWLRSLRCFDICDSFGKTSYRFDWGEFSTGWRFCCLEYSVYHDEGTLRIGLIFGTLYLKVPMIIKQREGTEDWNASFGISFHDKAFWWHWRTNLWTWYPFGDWTHVRHEVQLPDGRFVKPEGYISDIESIKDGRLIETHDYTYVLNNGTVQHRKATICVQERELRWKYFVILPYPRIVRRTIDIAFDDEVGEGTGSWKGGTTGCGYELKPNETPLACLRRMESERKFR